MSAKKPEGFNFDSPPPIHTTYQTPQGIVSVTEAAHSEYGLMAMRLSNQEHDSIGVGHSKQVTVGHLYIAGKNEMPGTPVYQSDHAYYSADVSFGSGVLFAVSSDTARPAVELGIGAKLHSDWVKDNPDAPESEWSEILAHIGQEDGIAYSAHVAAAAQEEYMNGFGEALKRHTAITLPQQLWTQYGCDITRRNRKNSVIAFGAAAAVFGIEATQATPPLSSAAVISLAGLGYWAATARKGDKNMQKLANTTANIGLLGVATVRQLQYLFGTETSQEA